MMRVELAHSEWRDGTGQVCVRPEDTHKQTSTHIKHCTADNKPFVHMGRVISCK